MTTVATWKRLTSFGSKFDATNANNGPRRHEPSSTHSTSRSELLGTPGAGPNSLAKGGRKCRISRSSTID